MKKKILITGVTGFLGSHLAKALLIAGYEVVAIKRKSSSLNRVEAISKDITFFDIEGTDLDKFFQICSNINTIIKTATCYGRNNESVSEIFTANAEFLLRLNDAGR